MQLIRESPPSFQTLLRKEEIPDNSDGSKSKPTSVVIIRLIVFFIGFPPLTMYWVRVLLSPLRGSFGSAEASEVADFFS